MVFLTAGAAATETYPVLNLGFDTGGTSVAVIAPNGQKIDSVHLGQGTWLGVGASILDDSRKLESQLTFSWLYNNTSCPNPCPTGWHWNRALADAMAFYRWRRARLGMGLTFDLYSKLEAWGDASGLDALDLKSEPGARLQLDWIAWDNAYLGLRYTRQYFRDSSGTRLNGSGAGVVFTLFWLTPG
jgi:hypothetical protein